MFNYSLVFCSTLLTGGHGREATREDRAVRSGDRLGRRRRCGAVVVPVQDALCNGGVVIIRARGGRGGGCAPDARTLPSDDGRVIVKQMTVRAKYLTTDGVGDAIAA